MDHVKSDFCCPMCNLKVKKKLCEDLPGVHTYVWACDGCKREYSSEWIEGAPWSMGNPTSLVLSDILWSPNPPGPGVTSGPGGMCISHAVGECAA